MSKDAKPVGRLAPSPTGAQHLGNARTYLLAWLNVRVSGGRIILRHEDIDSPRTKPGAMAEAEADLRWLGLDWDDGPYVQTQRLALYEAALESLKQRELVYPCTCTRADVERAASAPHADHEGPPYPGTCAGRRVRDALDLAEQHYAWRFRSQATHQTFHDDFLGEVTVARANAGDFVVWKSAGTPAYQLAVVVDDHDLGVTEVLRGDDLVPSTPRQLQLYEALGWAAPRFAHVPLVVGPDGRRLAKRHGDTRLSSLRLAGVDPHAVLRLLAWSCGFLLQQRSISLAELRDLFDLALVPRAPFVVTPELLAGIGYDPATAR